MILYEYRYMRSQNKVYVTKFEAKETPKAYFINDKKALNSRVLKSEIGKLCTSSYQKVMYLTKPDFNHYKELLIFEEKLKIEHFEQSIMALKKAIERLETLKEGELQ